MVMAKYLADTTLLVDHLRKDEKAKEFLIVKGPSISQASVAELIEGAKNKLHLNQINITVGPLEVVPISENISSSAIELMLECFLSHGLEFMDALIAATAMENNLTLVTANVKHFSFIKRLKLLDWEKIANGEKS